MIVSHAWQCPYKGCDGKGDVRVREQDFPGESILDLSLAVEMTATRDQRLHLQRAHPDQPEQPGFEIVL